MQGLPDNSITRESWIYQFPGPAIGKVFSGNKELAGEYLGVGMALLFNCKSIMRNGLLGSLSMTRTMEDGTVIRVNSFYGNDLIMIDAPFKAPEPGKARGEFIFRITRSDGVIMTDSPLLSNGVLFSVISLDGSEFYSGLYPTQPDGSTLLVLYEDGLWTLRKRSGVDDLAGDFFDADTFYFVEYQFFETAVGHFAYYGMRYPGVRDPEAWVDPVNAIRPGGYECTVDFVSTLPLPEEKVTFLFNVVINGRVLENGVTAVLLDDAGHEYPVYDFMFIGGSWRARFNYDPNTTGSLSARWKFSPGLFPKIRPGIIIPGSGEPSGPHDVPLWYFEGGSGPGGIFLEGDLPVTNLAYTFVSVLPPNPPAPVPPPGARVMDVSRWVPDIYPPHYGYYWVVGKFFITNPNS